MNDNDDIPHRLQNHQLTSNHQIKAKTTFTIVNFSENLISYTTEMQPNYIKKYLLVEDATSKKIYFPKMTFSC